MNPVLPSSKVGVKINEWYKMIRQFSVPDAEILKAEVEQEINQMEEDEYLLIYFSLMKFRHQLMLDYLEPVTTRIRPTIDELLEKIEASNKGISGLLSYYSLFFRGMYEFDQKQYVKAIAYYREAEKELIHVPDEIERAEFHFKLAEAYYGMKQSHVSMHHVKQALDVYNQYELYKVRKVQCLFVISGNYIDFKRYEKSQPHLEKALELSRELNNKRLISSALYNLGTNFADRGDYQQAEVFMKQAVEITEKEKLTNLPHSLFSYAKILFKQGKMNEAIQVSKKGLSAAIYQGDELFTKLQGYLKALYVDAVDQQGVNKTIEYLERNKNYSYVEDIACETAAAYANSKEFETSYVYHQKMIETQTQIQRGECQYDF
ncbi:response regulator aspartate phosphatase [Bacillus spizizenii ATCC 6633 = JCM 2499]|uniref:Aspartate phosphatase response regulator n=2 Tax=Bacillus spizizenii TaxID=96241 RepID=E0TZN7_BACSH|nr:MULTISPECIES: Rap family tetratricopeptide repeat protein [Bacillus]QCJ16505.1 tetratricopeptide repeat protein [Bacillus subtilis]ADM37262.1 aspartate phosphatase response regulator [Bacillus spizizenii str. W23]AJW86646.1 aspartate phosphatase [Bacillus spizizenii]EFG91424.1 aspartate phosphatase response regulator [Bacillus spizizenii ATCC 6633 = JCM 2499]KFK79496.1 tetratricopeptide repeat family protein [Bacillus spizizenii]